MKPIASVFSPAYPAVLLLYGMLFAFAVTHFTAIPWSPSITIAVYATALVWVFALVWWSRRNLGPITTIDMLFTGFVLVVAASLVFQGGLQAGGWKYARFMPFMMIAPYLCGRLMRMQDLDLFSRIVMYAGVGILPLLLLDRMVSTDMMEGTRWTFFGRNHSPLLIGALLAAALLGIFVRAPHLRNSEGGAAASLWSHRCAFRIFGLGFGARLAHCLNRRLVSPCVEHIQGQSIARRLFTPTGFHRRCYAVVDRGVAAC